jgi:predicted aspartyl protease
MTGMFPINNHYAFFLFDTGADKSFVSIEFAMFIKLELSVAPEPYSVELANGKLLEVIFVALSCILNLHDHLFA